uniref:Uncharacterized protein n=1 Tax=Parascaris univalens TaxID=6257 RepID=A0A915A326_PARUN
GREDGHHTYNGSEKSRPKIMCYQRAHGAKDRLAKLATSCNRSRTNSPNRSLLCKLLLGGSVLHLLSTITFLAPEAT